MSGEHVIDLIDETGLNGLSDAQREAVHAHAAGCPDCRTAVDAWRIGSSLLTARASVTNEVSPFFATRVMAALRERRENEALGLAGMWRAAWSLVTVMALIVLVLTSASILRPGRDYSDTELSTGRTMYSPAFDAAASAEVDLTDDQLVGILYESEVTYEQ